MTVITPCLSLAIAAMIALAVFLSARAAVAWMGGEARSLEPAPPNAGPRSAEKLISILQALPPPAWVLRRFDQPMLGQQLGYAEVRLTGRQFVSLQWLSLWTSIAAACLVVLARPLDLLGWTTVSLLVAAGLLTPRLWLGLRVQRRQQDITLALPDLLDRLAFGLQAGLGFEVALRRLAPGLPGCLGDELRRVIRDLDLGFPHVRAMDSFARRTGSQEVRAFVAAVHQAEVLGTPLAEALRVQNELLRAARRRRAQEAGRRLPILILFPLVFFFLPALLIVYLAPPLLHLFLMR
jgi:Flp pilus assembly protein TadB